MSVPRSPVAGTLASDAEQGGPQYLARQPRRRSLMAQFCKDPTALAGLLIVSLLLLIALFAPVLAPYDPTKIDTRAILSPMSSAHWLGTDNLGRDVLSRLIHGSRWTLSLALLATVSIVSIGVTVGLIAGYFGGLIDEILMRIVDVLLAFPSLVLALAIVGMLGPSLRNVLIGMVAVWWTHYARIIRGVTISIRNREYVTAAHCAGCSHLRIVSRHLFPNVIPPVIVLSSLEIGSLMLALSGLSFLGLGAQPPTPEWGTMLNESRVYFQRAPQLMLFPGIAMTLAVMGFNLLGDGLRDLLDPRMSP